MGRIRFLPIKERSTRLLIAIVAAILMSACSTVVTNSKGWIEPIEAIRAANEDPAQGVRGEFIVTVKALDSSGGWSFVNSEQDYRDQRNLTIKMPTAMVPALEQNLGVKFSELMNRRLVFRGVAKRVRINFTNNGLPSGKYYYQTHVQVEDPSQIRFAN
ncbi:MAG TPA: hypothetical protein VFN25_01220 [Dokdonella sp.]|uniref:hypothetical protein n=1 Tax=Dokdonella sp. TaxID=2291710 RepID=UPI002D80BDF2|nr:hypothetical protein [Dokdonella sp.]HET9031502.1 hypothetical protein [Dokdonella sp.]